ncbi:hypothetical protein Syun_030123 [Stephania yunnanensis]|uniref:Uncharacterized protein n=1 Tax=Stephania yunnanensis TaxID=152371 RepID=A0AAP0EF90_9MAGN
MKKKAASQYNYTAINIFSMEMIAIPVEEVRTQLLKLFPCNSGLVVSMCLGPSAVAVMKGKLSNI